MALAHCILGNFLGVVCHCFPLPLDVSTLAARCLHVPINASAPSSESGTVGENGPVIFRNDAFFTSFRDLLHVANLRHGANGFTSLPKEGMLRIFRPKNPTASAGSEPAILGTRDQHANH
jgi:hypothetical protein